MGKGLIVKFVGVALALITSVAPIRAQVVLPQIDVSWTRLNSGMVGTSNSHWETGKAGRNWAMTREPGDLPAQSPNRWTGGPYGAVFRSGDVNAGAKAVAVSNSPTTSSANVVRR